MAMSTEDTLLAFSEWLDSEGILPVAPGDHRTHQDLVSQFVGDWESTATRATLAGREPVTGSEAPTLPLDEHARNVL